MSYAILYNNTKKTREHDEHLRKQILNERSSKTERTVLFHGKDVLVNKLRIDRVYKHVNETKNGYGLEHDHYKIVVCFSKIKNNPRGYVVFTIQEESHLVAFKKAYEGGKEINLDQYELNEEMCFCD